MSKSKRGSVIETELERERERDVKRENLRVCAKRFQLDHHIWQKRVRHLLNLK